MKLSALVLASSSANAWRFHANDRVDAADDRDVEHKAENACDSLIGWLNTWNKEAQPFFNNFIVADWNNNVDITEEHDKITQEKEKEFKTWVKQMTQHAEKEYKTVRDSCKKTDPSSDFPKDCCLQDEVVPPSDRIQGDLHKYPMLWTKERQFRALDKILTYKVYGEQDMDSSSLDEKDLETYQNSMSTMVTAYNTQKIVSYDGKNMFSLDPEIYETLDEKCQEATPEAYEEMKYYWYNWHDKVGAACREPYETFVGVSNKAATNIGYTDTGDSWRAWYEDENFEKTVDDIWKEVSVVYKKIHAHVRHTLFTKYGSEYVDNREPIPAHLLGNMWAQSWESIYPLVEPFSMAGTRPDATPEIQKLEIDEMYEMSEDFFASLGFWNMTDTFWKESVRQKKENVEMVCHASAWDFMAGPGEGDDGSTSDYRIKQCTVKTHSNFVTLHHEMGHIVYFQQYAHQPIIFRTGGNPGFHEAIGDSIALAVNTPKHLSEVGLLPGLDSSQETMASDLNYLMQQALDKITFLPFGLLMDKYRWSIFKGDTKPDQYQTKWDELRREYQGVISPVERQNTDFDAAGKFHISNNVPYIRYFVSFIVQFQFYEKMCIEAGQYDPKNPTKNPLYKCDFYKNEAAGAAFEKLMTEGAARPWQEILDDFLCSGQGQSCDGTMSSKSILNYFAPLEAWLDEQQEYYQYPVGWSASDWVPKGYHEIPHEKEYEPEEDHEPEGDSGILSTLAPVIALITTMLHL